MDGRPRFRRRQRLAGAELGAVLAAGSRRRGDAISVQMRANKLQIARLGLIVPKRHVPRAVDRNRVKRILREWFRHRQSKLQGQDMLIRVLGPLAEPGVAVRDMNRLFEEKQ